MLYIITYEEQAYNMTEQQRVTSHSYVHAINLNVHGKGQGVEMTVSLDSHSLTETVKGVMT